MKTFFKRAQVSDGAPQEHDKRLKQELEKEAHPLKSLASPKQRPLALLTRPDAAGRELTREVILSEYLTERELIDAR